MLSLIHILDITGVEDNKVGAGTLNQAIQKASGDQKCRYELVIMHSAVATNLEQLQLLEYMKYTDKNGVERNLSLATWNGRIVLIDDTMPLSLIHISLVTRTSTERPEREPKSMPSVYFSV